jgi:hypothetical protein
VVYLFLTQVQGAGLKSHLDMRDVFFKNNRNEEDMKRDYFHKMGVFDREKEFYKVLLVEITFVQDFLGILATFILYSPV